MDANTDVVRKALQQAFSEHRFDRIGQLFSPDFVQHSPYASRGGRDARCRG